MSKTYLEVTFGSVKKGLNYKMGAKRHLGELMQKMEKEGSNAILDDFNYLKMIVHAGLLCNCDIKKEPVDFEDKDVALWVGSLDKEEADKILEFFQSAFGKAPGEGADNTQREAPDME